MNRTNPDAVNALPGLFTLGLLTLITCQPGQIFPPRWPGPPERKG